MKRAYRVIGREKRKLRNIQCVRRIENYCYLDGKKYDGYDKIRVRVGAHWIEGKTISVDFKNRGAMCRITDIINSRNDEEQLLLQVECAESRRQYDYGAVDEEVHEYPDYVKRVKESGGD